MSRAVKYVDFIDGIGPIPDYPRMNYYAQRHHERYARRVSLHTSLVCQECGGGGGSVEPVLDDGSGPWEPCGWCEGTGRLTPFLRGMWLRQKYLDKHTFDHCVYGTVGK